MDPLSALSIAASTIQFVDFGTRLLSDARDVYISASGQTQDVVHLSTIAGDLSYLSQNIQKSSVNISDDSRSSGSIEATLFKVCVECIATCGEIQTAISKLGRAKTKEQQFTFGRRIDRAYQSFAIALKNIVSSRQLSTWQGRLKQAREQMMVSLLAVLWAQSTENVATLAHISLQQDSMAVILNNIREDTMTLKQDLEAKAKAASSKVPTDSDGSSSEFSDDSCVKAIVSSLRFSGADQRVEAIPKAYEDTFKWIFNEPPLSASGEPLWSPLTTWLEDSSSGIYWITGKPGAGKSTMMKYLMKHPVMRQGMECWSQTSGRRLLWGTFYCWNAGTPIQRSREGLLRALLSQCLDQAPDLTPQICPQRWALCKLIGPKSLKRAPEWQWDELMEAFSLLSLLVGTRVNLALLIDGLDEFEGEYEKVIDFLEVINSRKGSKVCVASRPWNVFADAFKDCRQLKMEQITAEDIRLYVQGTFDRTPAFRIWRDSDPKSAERLIDNVITKAQGVFLWVSVVVKQLRLGLTEGDKLSEIEATLENLPSDLSSLYNSIWRMIKPSYIGNSSEIFQIHQSAIDGGTKLDIWLLYFADEEEHALRDIDVYDETKRKHIAEIIRRRLNSRTRGLLEIANDDRINYLHRTVKEWIQPMWPEIRSKAPRNFNAPLSILKALVLYHSSVERLEKHIDIFVMRVWCATFQCFRHAGQVGESPGHLEIMVQLLDRLDLKFTTLWNTHRRGRSGSHFGDRSKSVALRRATAISKYFYPFTSSVTRRSATKLSGDIHWPQTQFSNWESSQNNMTFIGVAAQLGVPGSGLYVAAKCKANQEYLSLTSSCPSILTCAVLGFELLCTDSRIRQTRQDLLGNPQYGVRMNLIKQILDEIDTMEPRAKAQWDKEIKTLIGQVENSPSTAIYRNEMLITTALRDNLLDLLKRSTNWRRTAGAWISGIGDVR